jgi:hypothetical protein
MLKGLVLKFKTVRKEPKLNVAVLKHAKAMRVIFYYPEQEATFIDQAWVTLFENGIVHIKSNLEETTSHLSHVEIIWKFETMMDKSKMSQNVVPFRALNKKDSETHPESNPDV